MIQITPLQNPVASFSTLFRKTSPTKLSVTSLRGIYCVLFIFAFLSQEIFSCTGLNKHAYA